MLVILCSVFQVITNMSALQVYQCHSLSLVQCLPMDDVVFITKLSSSGLLPGNLKVTVQSQPTSMEKAMKFLDQAVFAISQEQQHHTIPPVANGDAD